MNFFTDDFKEHVFKGTPISDCFQMKMVLWFSSSLRNSWDMCCADTCILHKCYVK